ncbi:MAG: hypothetical protein ACYSWO_24550 [Planctomycetota bacterium]
MKRITIAIAIAVAVVLLMLGLGEVFAKGKDGITGNGAPNGAHYNLNIIGMPKGKTAEMKNSNGHVIFVNIDGHSKIFLQEGDDYDVLDKNGTDKDGALFQLPNPDPDYDGLTEYSIWARALGKAKGSASITTTVASDGTEVLYLQTLEVEAAKGKRTFSNVSRSLLYVYADITADDVDNPVLYPLFDDRLEEYAWDYDANGQKLVQLRFYEIPTTAAAEAEMADPAGG